MNGSGVARQQTPEPGALLMPGTECTITFGGR
jgi:hypothetical protein